MQRPDFFADLEQRDLVYQISAPQLVDLLRSQRVTGYIGFDPTADSLHVGSLLPLLTLRRFQQAGHQAIALIGGATGLVGDPSGKESERTLLSRQELEVNCAGLRRQIAQFLDLEHSDAILVDNAEWLGPLNLLDFLRDIGKHFSVNQMIARESVRKRLESREQGISYTEFSYMLLQAYDFLALYDRYGCILQMGGSDQWGNILSGSDLIRRLRGVETYGLTFPLVTRSDGRKFGKSEEGNIWLDPARTSPYQFYQFWLNVDDADVVRYLKFFTMLPLAEIEELACQVATAPERREAQRALAREVTLLVHGPAALQRAERATAVLFAGDADYRRLSAQELEEAFRGAPTSTLDRRRLGTPQATLLSVLTEVQLYPSRSRARAELAEGGISVNNVTIRDASYTLSEADLLHGRYIILRKGKKHYHMLRVAADTES